MRYRMRGFWKTVAEKHRPVITEDGANVVATFAEYQLTMTPLQARRLAEELLASAERAGKAATEATTT